MNVFLGFYIPSETSMHLWDLDSDYYLHNRYLRPPTPYINRILYEQNRLNRSNSETNSVDDKNIASHTSQSRHLKISKKYFIQGRPLLKIKDEEKIEGIVEVKNVEERDSESESEDKVGQGDQCVPSHALNEKEENEIG